MKLTLLRFLIAPLTFLIGISCVQLWSLHDKPSPTMLRLETPESPQSLSMKLGHETYRPNGIDQTYEMSDGTQIHSSCEYLSSTLLAAQELQRRVNQASDVTYLEPQLDGMGRKVGERVIIKSPKLIGLWITNNVFCEAEGASEKHLQWRLDR
jgi:hypothetical protein